MILQDRHREGIRIATNFRHFRNDLICFDRWRFRGLGERHTANFITHAVRVCDAYALCHYDAVLYVMKAMCFLGSHMLEDPRFPQLAEALRGSTRYGDTRMKDFSHNVEAVLTQFAGPELITYRAFLAAAVTALRDQFSPPAARKYIMSNLPSEVARRIVQEWRPYLVASAQEAANELGLEGEWSRTICLGSAAILGCKFHRDPLYPWVQDLTTHGRPDHLDRFLAKRMAKQLRRIEAHYGV